MVKNKTITIHDIAKQLNINASTVSRALNGNPRISKNTCERVKKTARELNYQPNTIASALRKGKANTIGLVVPLINRFFFADTISGIESVTSPAGYNLLICQSNENFIKEVANINTLIENRVDGIIISVSAETMTSEHLMKALDRDIPLLQFDRVIMDINVSKVVNDNFAGAYMAVSHLIAQGYKFIAHVGGPLHINIYNERFEGYKKALIDAGLMFEKDLVFHGIPTYQFGRDCAETFNTGKIRADAVFCSGDFAALGVMKFLKEKGCNIPRDFGLVGFANEQFTQHTEPGISSLDQFAFDMGSTAARLLLEEINSEIRPLPKTVLIKPELIIRGSSQKTAKKVTE